MLHDIDMSGWDDFHIGDRVRNLREHPGFGPGNIVTPAGHLGTVTEDYEEHSGRPCMGIRWDELPDGTRPFSSSLPISWRQAPDSDPEVYVIELVETPVKGE